MEQVSFGPFSPPYGFRMKSDALGLTFNNQWCHFPKMPIEQESFCPFSPPYHFRMQGAVLTLLYLAIIYVKNGVILPKCQRNKSNFTI